MQFRTCGKGECGRSQSTPENSLVPLQGKGQHRNIFFIQIVSPILSQKTDLVQIQVFPTIRNNIRAAESYSSQTNLAAALISLSVWVRVDKRHLWFLKPHRGLTTSADPAHSHPALYLWQGARRVFAPYLQNYYFKLSINPQEGFLIPAHMCTSSLCQCHITYLDSNDLEGAFHPQDSVIL